MINKLLSAVIILLVFSFTHLHAEETWKITSLDWQPYSGADMASQGNSIQKLRELLKKKDINLVVEFYPWIRAQKKAAQADYVGYFPAWPEEVAEGFFASPAVDWSSISIMKQNKTTLDFKTIDDLFKNHQVGYVRTYVYPDEISSAIKKYPDNAKPSENENSLVKMLVKGRYSAALTDPNVMLYVAEKQGVSGIEVYGEELMKKELVIAFRNGVDNQKRLNVLKELLNKP